MTMNKKAFIFVISCLFATCLWADKGDILASFSTGQSAIAGIDVREISLGTELHVQDTTGQIYKYGINAVSSIKDGRIGVYNGKSEMMDPNSLTPSLRGLAVMPTYQGSFGWQYLATNSQRILYGSTWGYPEGNDPGLMTFGGMSGAWTLLMAGDICPTARGKVNDQWPMIWGTFSGTVGDVYEDVIYKYPNVPWTGRNDYVARLEMDKALQGVSIGDADDLWVLCQDGEILNVDDTSGAVLDRFFIDSTITGPWGIAYDPSEKSLWISNTADKNVYQIDTGKNVFMTGDLNHDYYLDIEDFSLFASQWIAD